MGPTASGKTTLAVELVQRFPFDIVSVDSAMVYRGLNIGAAKPDPATLTIAPHRLIDILDPAEVYSAARFRADALSTIAKIHAQGRIPLLVGGTMLYFRVLQQGLSELPSADPAVRAQLAADLASQGAVALHERLHAIDPQAAARIHPNDRQRLLRALEVYQLSGRPLTELCTLSPGATLPYQAFKVVLAPAERSLLQRAIERRFGQMLEQGFITEVEQLRARGDLDLQKPSMRAVGYRQVWEYLDGKMSYADMAYRGVTATRQFAKRQLTWLRAEPQAAWFDSLAPELLSDVVRFLKASKVIA